MIDQLVTLLVFILILGVLWWVLTSFVPIPAPFMRVAQAILALIVILMLVSIFFGGYHFQIMRR